MSSSIFIARLIGPIFLVAPLAFVLRLDRFRAVATEFAESKALLYLGGFLGLLAGLALVLTHNVWSADWRIIITLVGWISIGRGLGAMLWPDKVAVLARTVVARTELIYAAAGLYLVIGLVLCYFGYVAPA